MSKEKRLGRGLAALLGASVGEEAEVPLRNPGSAANPSGATGSASASGLAAVLGATGASSKQAPLAATADSGSGPVLDGLIYLPVDQIETNPFQPRRVFSEAEIASLAESLKQHQMIQPLVVRRVGEKYQLISGERRLRAATKAGWREVPVTIREADDRLVAEIAIVENLHRQDLNPIEKALSFQRYLKEHRCTQEEMSERIKINRSTIANLIRLLELPKAAQEALAAGQITSGHAKALLPLGDEREQLRFLAKIQAEGMSVREVEAQVQDLIDRSDADPLDLSTASTPGSSTSAGKKGRTQNPQLASLETDLRRALGTKVELRASSRGRGRMVIHFKNHEEFERIRAMLTGDNLIQRKAA